MTEGLGAEADAQPEIVMAASSQLVRTLIEHDLVDEMRLMAYPVVHKDVGLVVSDPEQVILESDPFRRLSYSWHSFTSGWAAEVGMDEATAEAG